MKYQDEFRNSDIALGLSKKIKERLGQKEATIMEVCGTHTMAIHRFGLKKLLPKNLNLLSGPGCPVCVTQNRYLDEAVALARQPDTIITTFGDMLRVPGSSTNLEKQRALGADIRIVYSPLDAVKIARENPQYKVVFLAVGFETTAPTIGASLLQAKDEGLKNFYIHIANKLLPPALEALLNKGDISIDGFILPGHVSTIIGSGAYGFISKNYHIPSVIAGFEPLDILYSILMIVKQLTNGDSKIEIEYTRSVKPEGNLKALEIMSEIFEPQDEEWRGLGLIPKSGLRLKNSYINFDATQNIDVNVEETKAAPGCICDQILRGAKRPSDCALFGKQCTPEDPVGSCMVSSEGTCAAFYKYLE